MTNTKGKRRGTCYVFSGPFRKMEWFLWPHTCESTRKAILSTSREWALLKKECPQMLPRQSGTSLQWASLEMNKLKTRFVPREVMYVLGILSTLAAETAPDMCDGKASEKVEEPKRKCLGSSEA